MVGLSVNNELGRIGRGLIWNIMQFPETVSVAVRMSGRQVEISDLYTCILATVLPSQCNFQWNRSWLYAHFNWIQWQLEVWGV